MTDKKTQGYINVHDVDPDIIVDLKYATTDNFTHQVVYDLTRQFLESIPFTSLPKQVRTSRVKGTESKFGTPTGQLMRKSGCLKFTPTQSGLPNRIQTSVTKRGYL